MTTSTTVAQDATFDAIVVGSGMSGGWAAKELAERGLKVLVIERGKHVEHGSDYKDSANPWELENFGDVAEEEIDRDYAIQTKCYAFSTDNKDFWVKDSEHPYTYPEDKPFFWIRGYHLGGRSIMWGRQSYRMSPMDFEANKQDGYGVDWPIRYDDLTKWYDYVERFAGISGSAEALPQLPDSQFQPPMAMLPAEADVGKKIESLYPGRKMIIGRCAHLTQPTDEQSAMGRGPCQYRSLCTRGCSYGAYFSSLSATLPAALATGNVTIVTDQIAHSVEYDPATKRATGVRVIDRVTKEGRTFTGRIIFLCASTIGSAQIMLNSRSEAFPNGIANRSDQLGRNLMDHISFMGASGVLPGYDNLYYQGRRPNGIYIPRYRNVTEPGNGYVRGFGMQGGASREGWQRGASQAGIGADLKNKLRQPGRWIFRLHAFGEMLPRPENRVTLRSDRVDQWGIPVLHIEAGLSDNEQRMMEQANADAVEMLTRIGCTDVTQRKHYGGLGLGIHEMGTARMGHDPATSVLNKFNQAHDVPNLFVTDGACMTSSACQNPSLTYMAMSARGAHHATEFLKAGLI